MGRRPSKSRLAALTAAGWLIRLRRSDDLVVPLKQLPEHATTVGDAWLLAAAISGPCPVVGGWSAAEHRGLTEQLFRSTLSNPELPRPILHTTSGSCKPHLWHPASSGSVKYAPCALGQALEQAVHWIRQFRPVILAESTTLAGVRERAGDAGVGHLDPVSHKYGAGTCSASGTPAGERVLRSDECWRCLRADSRRAGRDRRACPPGSTRPVRMDDGAFHAQSQMADACLPTTRRHLTA